MNALWSSANRGENMSFEQIYQLPIYPEPVNDDDVETLVHSYRDWIQKKMDKLWIYEPWPSESEDRKIDGFDFILIPATTYYQLKEEQFTRDFIDNEYEWDIDHPYPESIWEDHFVATEVLQAVIDNELHKTSHKCVNLFQYGDGTILRGIQGLQPKHKPVFELVNGKMEYRFSKVTGPLGAGMVTIEALLASNIPLKYLHENSNYLEIEIRKSGLEEIDNYHDRIDVNLLRNPKEHGVMFHYPDNESVLVFHEAKERHMDTLRFLFLKQSSPYAGVSVPITMLLPKKGIISSKQLRDWLKPLVQIIMNQGFTGPEANMKDNNFIEMANIMMHQGIIVPEIGWQFLDTPEEYLETNTVNIPMHIDEHVYDLLFRSFKAFILLRSPQIVEKIKSDTKKARQESKTFKKNKRTTRVWGSDKIRYIYPPKRTGKKLPYHFVRGHVRRLPSNKITNVKPHYKGSVSVGYSDNAMAIGKSAKGGYSQMALNWLRSIELSEGISIQHAESGGELRVRHSKGHYLVDGYCEETNTVYEFHGDIWHGNPACFSPDECPHPFRPEITAKQLHEATIAKEDFLRQHFKVITIWETDWLTQK